MKRYLPRILVLVMLFVCSVGSVYSATPTNTLTCVGIYSETSDGSISYRPVAGKGAWIVVKVGDVIPLSGEIKINVDRDWIELIVTGKPTEVYELNGPETGEVIKKGADILKMKPRTVAFPKGTAANPDPAYKNKLVVQQYLGRQVYIMPDGDRKDIRYGDVLDIKGKVRIIAINNTLTLMNASGATTTIIGPLNFTIEQVLTNQNLYKFLNVQK
jgi:hypothetical protein